MDEEMSDFANTGTKRRISPYPTTSDLLSDATPMPHMETGDAMSDTPKSTSYDWLLTTTIAPHHTTTTTTNPITYNPTQARQAADLEHFASTEPSAQKRFRHNALDNTTTHLITNTENPANPHLNDTYLLSDFSTNPDSAYNTTTNPNDLLVDHAEDEMEDDDATGRAGLEMALQSMFEANFDQLQANYESQFKKTSTGAKFLQQQDDEYDLEMFGNGGAQQPHHPLQDEQHDQQDFTMRPVAQYSDDEYDEVDVSSFVNAEDAAKKAEEDANLTAEERALKKKHARMGHGLSMLVKLGWSDGTGLGVNREGRADIVQAHGQGGQRGGLGFGAQKPPQFPGLDGGDVRGGSYRGRGRGRGGGGGGGAGNNTNNNHHNTFSK